MKIATAGPALLAALVLGACSKSETNNTSAVSSNADIAAADANSSLDNLDAADTDARNASENASNTL